MLTFSGKGNIVKYNVQFSEKRKSYQIWEVGYPDDQGWFNISSLKAVDKYLTVKKIGNTNQLTMEKASKFAALYHINFYYHSVLLLVNYLILSEPVNIVKNVLTAFLEK